MVARKTIWCALTLGMLLVLHGCPGTPMEPYDILFVNRSSKSFTLDFDSGYRTITVARDSQHLLENTADAHEAGNTYWILSDDSKSKYRLHIDQSEITSNLIYDHLYVLVITDDVMAKIESGGAIEILYADTPAPLSPSPAVE